MPLGAGILHTILYGYPYEPKTLVRTSAGSARAARRRFFVLGGREMGSVRY